MTANARLAVISLGGTIAMTKQVGGGLTPTVTSQELIEAIPGLDDAGLELELFDFRQVPGASLSIVDIVALASEIRTRIDAGATGVVITQGTDTIEETAYVLDLLITGETPIVVTGAMRSPAIAGADGPANLFAALQVASSPAARGLGCLVVLADEIHAARNVRKTHTTSTGAFTSWPGPIGYVTEGQVKIQGSINRSPSITGVDASRAVHTAVVTATLGDDGTLLKVIGEHTDGVVLSAFGAGHVPAAWIPVVSELVADIPVILSSRTGAGSILTRTYSFTGSERDLLARGVIPAGDLGPLKARLLLHLLLLSGLQPDDIAKAFDHHLVAGNHIGRSIDA